MAKLSLWFMLCLFAYLGLFSLDFACVHKSLSIP